MKRTVMFAEEKWDCSAEYTDVKFEEMDSKHVRMSTEVMVSLPSCLSDAYRSLVFYCSLLVCHLATKETSYGRNDEGGLVNLKVKQSSFSRKENFTMKQAYCSVVKQWWHVAVVINSVRLAFAQNGKPTHEVFAGN